MNEQGVVVLVGAEALLVQRPSRGLGLLSLGVGASCLSWVCPVIEVGDLQHETATGLVCRGRGYCFNNGVPFLKSF